MRNFIRILGIAVAALLVVLLGIYGTMRAGWWNPSYDYLVNKYAAPPSKFATVDGATLHYRDEGTGRAIVFLHGTSSSLHQWDLVADRLKTKYRVIRLDWPPYGLSIDPKGIYTTERAAALLGGLLDQLNIPKVTIVGTSNGGDVGLVYAASHPDRLDALAFSVLPLVRPLPLKPPSAYVRFMTWFFTDILPEYHTKAYYRMPYETTTSPNFRITPAELDSVYELNNLPGTFAHHMQYIKSTIEVFRTTDVAALAAKITVPVLIQWCDLDTVVVPKSKGEAAKASFSNAPVTLLHYADSGHFPMFEIPERFTSDLETFLDEHPPTAP